MRTSHSQFPKDAERVGPSFANGERGIAPSAL